MPKYDDFGRPIDQSVVAIARAIRNVETQTNYNAKGKSGESGAYQWMPGNYEAGSKKYFGEVLDKSPVNQDKVAYYQLKELKDKGYTPEQVASAWNSGSPEYKGKVGVNKFGVKYDVPAYVNKVMTEYLSNRDNALSIEYPKSGGIALAPVAHAAELDQPVSDAPQFDDVEKALGATGMPVTTKGPRSLGDILGEFSTGVAKGELQTLKGLGTVGQFLLDQSAGRVVNAILGKGFTPTGPDNTVADIYRPGTERAKAAEQFLAPKGTAESVGKGVERIAEFVLPASKIAKAEAGIDAMIQGAGFLKGAARVAAKAGIEGASGAGITLAQTGSPSEALTGGLVFGGLKGVTGAAGEAARAFRLPERIYSSIFKNALQDVKSGLTSEGLREFQKASPEQFQKLVKAGIIKTGKGGTVTVDDTLAKEALDKGLAGNLRTMSNTVVRKLYETEAVVRDIAAKSRAKITVDEKQFRTILQQIAQDYGDVGFGEFAQKAKALDLAIKAGKGQVSVGTGLEIRRLLDGLRTRSSFGAQSPRLSLSQQNLKFLANELRSRINSVKGMGDAMKEYSFYIEALEHLAREAARRGNNQIVSLIDSVFFSGAAIGNPAIGSALGLGRRLLSTPFTATKMAQKIQQGGTLTGTGAAVKGAITTGLLPSQGGQ